MNYPYMTIDLDKIEENCRALTALCGKSGIAVAAVTKATCGLPKVARALLRGGVKQLADSRLDNIQRMRNDGIRAEMMLLRSPGLSDVERVVELVDISLNSELAVIKALSVAAKKREKVHRILLMVDLGDLREGILPREAVRHVDQILACDGIELAGIGANLACLGGIRPSRENLDLLVYIAAEIRRRFALPLPMVSGGNTYSLPLLVSGGMPQGVNHLRLGAGLLLAGSPTPAALADSLHRDAFRLYAEVLEVQDKPSRPYGESGEDAFGKRPVFDEEEKRMKRAILGVGRAEIVPEDLFPIDAGVRIIGASSDHLVAEVTDASRSISVGSELAFSVEYGALLRAMTAPQVHKRPFFSKTRGPAKRGVHLLGLPLACAGEPRATVSAPDYLRLSRLVEQLGHADYAVIDEGNLAPPSCGIAAGEREQRISDRAAQDTAAGKIPLFIGGPHAALPGILLGIGRTVPECGVICFNSDGTLLADLLRGSSLRQALPSPENYALIGVRNLTVEDKRLFDQAAVTVFTIADIDRSGIAAVMRRALEITGAATHGIHVSIDMDFVDGREAPGVVQAEPGGLSYREAHLAMEMIAERRQLLSADLSEIVPEHDRNGATAKFAISLLASLLGRKVEKKTFLEDSKNRIER